jgi:superoxide dismutase, Cu-Zn family
VGFGATAPSTSNNGGIEMGKTKRLLAVAAAGIISLGALALLQETSRAGGVVARAELRNQASEVVGTVVFKKHGHEIIGIAKVTLPVATTQFRGFHIHANDVDNFPATTDGNPADGCQGNFTSVDGHWGLSGQQHGNHAGDLPVLMRDAATGYAEAEFVIGKFQPGDVIGKAVVIHADADNYANIPGRYVSSNSPSTTGPDATTLTNGDAGGRYACGVIVSAADED